MKNVMKTEKKNPGPSSGTRMVGRVPGTPLSKDALRRLEKLACMPDEEIDLSDIPEWTDEMWKSAVPNPWYKPVKKQLTLRVDADVIAWAKQKGAGYQTLLNSVLRAAMLAERLNK